MKKNGRKLFFWCLVFVFLSLSFNLAKQVANQLKLNKELKKKNSELFEIKENNKQLRAKLEEINSPKFLEKEAATILGLSKGGEPVVINGDEAKVENIPNQILEPPLPNFKRWLKLFFY